MIPINDKIKAYVRAEKISQKVLATRAGIRPQVLSNICTGIRTPGKKIIARIVAATGGKITPADLRPDWAEIMEGRETVNPEENGG